MKSTSKPRLYIPRAVFNKVMFFVSKCEIEVSGMGLCSYEPNGNYFWVRDVFLLEQEAGGAHTDIDAAALGKLEHKVLSEKLPGELNFWWHSHVNMPTFWSGTDLDTIHTIGANGYCLATVFNKKKEMRSAVCHLNTDGYLKGKVTFEDELETIVYDPQTKEEEQAWERELAEKVKRPKPTPVTTLLPAKTRSSGSTTTSRGTDIKVFTPTLKQVRSYYRNWKRSIDGWAPTIDELLACVILKVTPFELDDGLVRLSYQTLTEIDVATEEFLERNKGIAVEALA